MSAVQAPRSHRGAAILIAALVVGAVLSADAIAAAGDLDPTFSGDGKQTTGFAIGSSFAGAVAVQPDGKIVAVGTDNARRFNDFALARYNPDGSLDPSFSGDGKQRTDFVGSGGAAGVVLQPNGKIVVVGGNGGDFALARYNPNGSLDTSFGGDGKMKTNFGARDFGLDVALQADGKIVAVGIARGIDTSDDFALARYNTNGSPDTSFSGDGKQTTDFGTDFGTSDVAEGVAIQTNGRIVAVGSGGLGVGALARYNLNGSLDTSFSGDGKRTTNPGESFSDVGLQGDGKIVAVGGASAAGGNESDFGLARFNPNGTLDPSFSGDGRQTTDFGRFDGASALALQGDGRIVAVGAAEVNFDSDFALARYNPNGTLDPSFSGDGKRTTEFGGYSDGAREMALQEDGKIVAVGCGCGAGTDFALARYNPNGTLDPSFSGDGKRRTNFGAVDGAAGVAIQEDGKIVAAGDGFDQFALARYNADGSLDPSFSENGRVMTSFGAGDCCEGASAVALQDDGKIIAVGTTNSVGPFSDFAVARYNPDGSLDTSFSGDGKQTTDFAGGGDEVTGVAVQADGKVVVVGNTGGDFALARYNANGTLDPSFSGDGRQTTDFGGAFFDQANAVALQGDGKIVVAGTVDDFAPSDFALARYNINGSLDASFSGDGMERTDFGFSGVEAANGVALQGDGKIVAVGTAGDSPMGDDVALARYDTNGSLDPGFSGDGRETTDFGLGAGDRANGVALQADGKIVAVGVAGGGATADDFALARYTSNGALDPTFSGDGKRRTDFRFGDSDEANAVAIQGDGNIVAVGVGRAPNQIDSFALARYLGG